jgi:hypothetical protein
MNYYKRQWGETTGERLTDSWGTSTYYFEIDGDNFVLRQIQIFENGKGLKYSRDFIQDDYGALADQPLDLDDFARFKIEKTEFEEAWAKNYKK